VSGENEFAHGYHYGDYSGVNFYGPPTNGLWLDRLAVSDTFISPLLFAILDKSWRETGGEGVPRIASDWNTMTGWAAGGGPTSVTPDEATEFVEALAHLSPGDLAERVAGCSVDECLRCAGVIRNFIVSRLGNGKAIFIEDD
jgi:hypothetical protein